MKVEGYGTVTKKQMSKVAKWLAKADVLYQESEIEDILSLTDLFNDEHWESSHPLKDSLALTLDHLFRVCLQYPGLSEAQSAIADEFQNAPFGDDEVSRLFLSASRGAGKSVILTGFIVWLYINDPTATVLLLSSTSKLAQESLTMVKTLMDGSPFAKHLLPGKGDADAASYLDLNSEFRDTAAKDNSLFVAGITSRTTGRHPRYIILDDVEAAEAGRSATERGKIGRKMTTELSSMIKASSEKKARIIIVGTPHSFDSSYNKLNEELYHRVRFPAIYPNVKIEAECREVSQWMIDRVKSGEQASGDPTFPDRFGLKVLAAKRLEMGEQDYNLQFILDTTLADNNEHPLKLHNLIVLQDNLYTDGCCPAYVEWTNSGKAKIKTIHGLAEDFGYYAGGISEEFGEFSNTKAFIDVSAGGEDSTALTIITQVGGFLHVLESCEIPGGSKKRGLQKMASLLEKWECQTVFVETNFGGDFVTQVMRPGLAALLPFALDLRPFRVSGMKETRMIGALRPITNTHRLVFRYGALKGNDQLIKQYTSVKDKKRCLPHDDILDSLASCVLLFKDSMTVDPEKLRADIQTNVLEEMRADYQRSSHDPRAKFWDELGLSGGRRIKESTMYDPDTNKFQRVRNPGRRSNNSTLNNTAIGKMFNRR